MNLSMQMVQKMSFEEVFLQTIFREAESLLNESDAWLALKFVANSKNMDSYRSVVDFLFCELMGSPWTSRCRSFYKGKGRQAKDWLTPEEILHFDKILCIAIRYAQLCLRTERLDTWTKFRLEVRKLAA